MLIQTKYMEQNTKLKTQITFTYLGRFVVFSKKNSYVIWASHLLTLSEPDEG